MRTYSCIYIGTQLWSFMFGEKGCMTWVSFLFSSKIPAFPSTSSSIISPLFNLVLLLLVVVAAAAVSADKRIPILRSPHLKKYSNGWWWASF